MHRRKNTFLPLLVLFTMALQSCINDPSDNMKVRSAKGNVQFIIDTFTPESPTKTDISSDDEYGIVWSEGDLVGVFPKVGYQEPFTLETNQEGLPCASFSGGYWEMKHGMEYGAYYPFDIENFKSSDCKTSIQVTYDGQSQTGSSFGTGRFDYSYSDWEKADDATVTFNLHHIGALAVINLIIPRSGTYTKLRLDADSSSIPVTGHYDLTASRPAFIPDTFASSISLNLKDFNAKAGETCSFYLMLPPCDLSKAGLSVTLAMDEGYYLFDIDSRNFEASVRYDIEATMTKVGTRGSAKAWYNGKDTYVDWVQLWPGGPRFAEVDLEGGLQRDWTESRSTNDAARLKWGEYWYVPTKDEMTEFYNVATEGVGSTRISAYRSANEFKFEGKLEGYTDNILYLQSVDGGTYYLHTNYWTGTDNTALSILFSANYNIPSSCGWSASWSGSTSGNYLRPACALLNFLESEKPDPDPEPDPDPDSTAVDLGLSVKWSAVNLGAGKPEEHGSYYSWGETQAKDSYEEDTYLWGWESDMRKYCTSYMFGNKDDRTVLEAEDDAAHMLLGDKWRMPTDAEMEELQTQCSWVWSGSLCLDNNNNAHILKLDSEKHFCTATGRFDGLTVRPVID